MIYLEHVNTVWMIGLGIRCNYDGNSEYKREKTTQKISVMATHIPDGCAYYEEKARKWGLGNI